MFFENTPLAARKTVFIVDDHPFMRHGLTHFINSQEGLIVCGEADTAAAALESILALKPDLVIADIGLPGRNGLELTKDLRVAAPTIPVLVISMHEEPYYAERVLRSGARGYIVKRLGGPKLVDAINTVLSGRIYVTEEISARLLESLSGKPLNGADPVTARLTDRELQVMEMIGRARGSREIAEELHLSIKTVEAHRGNIKEKLNLRTAPELVRFAVQWVESQGK